MCEQLRFPARLLVATTKHGALCLPLAPPPAQGYQSFPTTVSDADDAACTRAVSLRPTHWQDGEETQRRFSLL
ncbi:hypothetical protein BT67DRAFT_232713 [Trichocladium antarcticum]|uniref:Uncharacterized protein n=1 Tax=Trichocladium antarcticum TaxID=1450529 RepID=A0AAN6UP60_9PEZI|nr:hypothetical protein BT67DRAFT_232713 [Trichocladium antarcticum]